MNSRYDVVVVGAGPAGSTVARYAAQARLSVLLLEKDAQVGMPVRCGEAVSDKSLEEVVPIDPRWIASTIKRFRLVSPAGDVVEPDIGSHGYVLNRSVFDSDLAQMAVEAGTQLYTECYVDGLIPHDSSPRTDDSSTQPDDSFPRGVHFIHKGIAGEVRANIIVAADGVESRVGRWAGIDTVTHMRDMETCAQMTPSGIDLEDEVCEFYFGSEVAPEGYLWVFPKGSGMANVGVGISGMASKHRSALHYLREIVHRRFPRAVALTTVAGGVPCATTVDRLIAGNVVLVGDAAHQVNPISGGGITSGMKAGKLAAEAIVKAVKNNNLEFLQEYDRSWRKDIGARHETYYKMKAAVHKFPDDVLNGIARDVLALKPEKRTIWGVFRIALRKHPSVVWEMVKTFGLSRL